MSTNMQDVTDADADAAPGLRLVDAAGRAVARTWGAFDHFRA